MSANLRSSFTPHAVLFDLDGTLADTALDLATAIDTMRSSRGMGKLPLEQLRPLVSTGVAGLLKAGFGISSTHPSFEAMRQEFLSLYAKGLTIHSTLFPGIDDLLNHLSSLGIPWGIVTNKITQFAKPLVAQLGLTERMHCLVCGDTTPHAKPHPAPLLHAANQLGIAPSNIVYVGDDLRDIQAGQAAQMRTLAAAYGYCGIHQPPEEWDAHDIAYSVLALRELLS
jgi:phosphoglycolate phosphatase